MPLDGADPAAYGRKSVDAGGLGGATRRRWAWPRSCSGFGGEGNDLGSLVGHDEGVLELRGAAAVGGHRGPSVVPGAVAPATQGQHGLDGEAEAGLHDRRGGGVDMMRNLHVGMKLLPDAVAAEAAD